MPEHEDQLGVQCTGAELQAAKHAALSMRAGVPSVAQDKEVPRKGIEDGFQGRAGICTTNQSSVGSLTHLCSNPHACSAKPCQLRGHPPRSAHCHPSAWPGHPVASPARSGRFGLGHTGWTAARSAWRTAAQLAVVQRRLGLHRNVGPVRTPRMPWSAAAPLDIEGGTCCATTPRSCRSPCSAEPAFVDGPWASRNVLAAP